MFLGPIAQVVLIRVCAYVAVSGTSLLAMLWVCTLNNFLPGFFFLVYVCSVRVYVHLWKMHVLLWVNFQDFFFLNKGRSAFSNVCEPSFSDRRPSLVRPPPSSNPPVIPPNHKLTSQLSVNISHSKWYKRSRVLSQSSCNSRVAEFWVTGRD